MIETAELAAIATLFLTPFIAIVPDPYSKYLAAAVTGLNSLGIYLAHHRINKPVILQTAPQTQSAT